MKEERYREMKELHKFYFPYFKKHILENQTKNKIVNNLLKNFVINRIGKRIGIRAYIFKKIWEISGLEDNEELYKLCSGIEMQLGQTYSWNIGADNKSKYGKNKKICFLTAKEMLNIHKKYIINNFNKKIWKIFENIYNVFYSAEVIDTLINLYPNLNKKISKILKNYINKNSEEIFLETGLEKKYINKIYERFGKKVFNKEKLYELVKLRTYGINAHMIEQYPEIIKEICKEKGVPIDKEKINMIKKYCKVYGMAMMIINDVQDFALDLESKFESTREKNKTDVFNDIINKKITYPLMYALISNDKEIENVIARAYNNPNKNNLENLRVNLLKKGYIKRSILEAVSYAHIGVDILRELGENKQTKMLEDVIISISLYSKYIKYLKEKYKVKLRPTKSEIKKRKEELKKELEKENLEKLLK